ncbi:MAG: UbiA family prenyltransferase [Candidatus Buchananbacteria bacterium]|nr:UbiA family prenyltransferase [Candidatus Buchananbacteria bacterium]
MIEKLFNKFRRIVDLIENSNIHLGYFIFTFLSIITIRNFLELFSTKIELNTAVVFFHFYIGFISLATLLILTFYILTRESIVKSIKIVLIGFSILPLPPIIDLIATGGRGFAMTYLLPEFHDHIILRFFTFFGHFEERGVSLGIKTEIFIILVLTFLYFLAKKHGVFRSIANAFIVYIIIFGFFAIPFILKGIFLLLGINYDYSVDAWEILSFLFLMMFFCGIIILYLIDKKNFITIAKDARYLRLSYYLGMFFCGIIVAKSTATLPITAQNLFDFLFTAMAITAAWLFSVTTNNIADYHIDKISNKNRPLVRRTIAIEDYKKISTLLLVWAIICSTAVGPDTLFLVILFISSYFIYSMPPIRLKRVIVLSKLIIALNSLVLVLLGFFTITKTIKSFPGILFPTLLIGITILANFIDIKDYEGDRKNNIKTLPTVLGLKLTKIIIGFSFVFFYTILYVLLPYYNLGNFWNFLFIPLGLLQFYFVNQKKYQDSYIIGTCVITVFLFAILNIF